MVTISITHLKIEFENMSDLRCGPAINVVRQAVFVRRALDLHKGGVLFGQFL